MPPGDRSYSSGLSNDVAQRDQNGSRLSRVAETGPNPESDRDIDVTSALTAPSGAQTATFAGPPPGAEPLPGQLDRWLASRGAELVAIRRHIHARPGAGRRRPHAPAAAQGQRPDLRHRRGRPGDRLPRGPGRAAAAGHQGRAVPLDGREGGARLRPRRAHHRAARAGPRPGPAQRAGRAARPGPAHLPARRGVRWSGSAPARSPRPRTRSASTSAVPAATPPGRT